ETVPLESPAVAEFRSTSKVRVALGAMVKAGTLPGRVASGTPGKLAIRVNPWGTVMASDTSRLLSPVFLTLKTFGPGVATGVGPYATVRPRGTSAPLLVSRTSMPGAGGAARPARLNPSAAAANNGSTYARWRNRREDVERVMVSLLSFLMKPTG